MDQFCSQPHGLQYFGFWPHSKNFCQFMERLSQQRKNFLNLDKLIVKGRQIKQFIDVSNFGILAKLFNNKSLINHDDVMKLVHRTICKIKIKNGSKKNWNIEETAVLIWIVNQFQYLLQIQFCNFSLENWQQIALCIPGKTRDQCLFKMLKFNKKNLHQYPWTQEESNILRNLVGTNTKKDWNKISEQLYFLTKTNSVYRLPKQCRQHWSSFIVQQFRKGPWNVDEDVKLLRSVMNVGKRWIEIGKQLPGRTQNAIKNRCNLLLSKCDIDCQTNFNNHVEQLIQNIKRQSQIKMQKRLSKKKKVIVTPEIKSEIKTFDESHSFKQDKIQFVNSSSDFADCQILISSNNQPGCNQSDTYQIDDVGKFLFLQSSHQQSYSQSDQSLQY